MKGYKNRIGTKEEKPRLSGSQQEWQGYYGEYPRRQRVLRKWYLAYTVTTVAAVVAVIFLFLFGVGNNNVPLRENLRVANIADKIVGWISKVDFPVFGGRDGLTDMSAPDAYAPSLKDTVSQEKNDTGTSDITTGGSIGGIYDFDYSKVPDGHTPIIPMDLSLSQYGDEYINNSTGYDPDTKSLINKSLGNGYQQLLAKAGPLVLIVHTHGTEAYSENGAISCPSDEEGYARTADTDENVVAVGKALADELIRSGIPTAHCTVLHDSIQYKDSYARAEETIKKYLDEYPSIKLVIDVHRDSIIKSSGEIVRPVTEVNGEAAAQVMCVVGSDWAGDECPQWENNLSLALKLRRELNSQYGNICRPAFLKGHTYNQEIAPYSLLLEIGSQGNSLEEAVLSARLVAQELSSLVLNI